MLLAVGAMAVRSSVTVLRCALVLPVLCGAVRTGIRSADVHTLNGAQYGQLLISRPDDPMVCHRAIEYLKERGLTVEEVRA